MAKNTLGPFSIVVIGGSAGSLDVIMNLLGKLSLQKKATYIIVVHRKSYTDTMLAELFATKTALPVKEVEDKESLLPGTVYLAPPDYHLLIENKKSFSLDASEKIHFSRPSIDVTFESAASVFGKEVIGVLLSGANADGALGLQKIMQEGGYTVVQDPATADVDYMPLQAIKSGSASVVVPADEIGSVIDSLLKATIK